MVTDRVCITVSVAARIRVKCFVVVDELGLGLGLEHFFERRSGDRTRVDGVRVFEKVPPGLGLGLGLRLGWRGGESAQPA